MFTEFVEKEEYFQLLFNIGAFDIKTFAGYRPQNPIVLYLPI